MKPQTFLAMTLLLGCSSGSQTDSKRPTCPDNTFRMSGTLDASDIDISSPLGSYFVVMAAGEGFGVDFGAQGSVDLTHSEVLKLGGTSSATGTLTMPTDAVTHAGETLCAGAGSSVTFEYNQGLLEGYTFTLDSLASGGSCDAALAGSLDGCFAPLYGQGP